MASAKVLLFCCVIALQVVAFGYAATTPLNFLSVGDWGSVNSNQSAVAKYMGKTAENINAQFLLAVGDNFYENGVANDTDPQWTTTYEDVFTAPSLNIPWYVIAGNHDHHLGRGQGEIDFYLNKRDSRWYFPSYWYNEIITLEDTKQTVEFVFIDTIILTCVDIMDPKSNLYDDMIDPTNCTTYPSAEHYEWLVETLQNSTADWLIVVGHYPIYSGGEHGDTEWLIQNVLPLLQAANADMYICGHDHTLQHLQSLDNPMGSTQFFLSGNGAKVGSYSPIPQSKFGVVDPGFMSHSLTQEAIVTTLTDHYGNELYSYKQARLVKPWEQKKMTNVNLAKEV